MRRLASTFFVLALTIFTVSCAGVVGTGTPGADAVVVTPGAAPIRLGATQQFTASVAHVKNPSVTWAVNNIPAGDETVGTITSAGALTAVYTAPTKLPSPNSVTITATVATNSELTGSTNAMLLNPIPVVSSVSPAKIPVGPFAFTITGSGFVSGSFVTFGSTVLATTFLSSTQLTATGTALSSQLGMTIPLTVTNPDPGSDTSGAVSAQVVGVLVTPEVADRFLEQSTFGPTTALISDVQVNGLQGFLSNQLARPPSMYPSPAADESDLGALQQRFFTQALYAPDQLRQRVAFALGQIFVISGNKIGDPTAFTQYLQMFSNDAFTNYRKIMEDVTLSPAMGHFLDMVNNDKPNPAAGTHANENYARELMQLFTIGTALLNEDGSLQLDAGGNPIATYTQDNVEAFSIAYTGWTYPTKPGETPKRHNPQYWIGPMVAYETNHDTNAKQLLQYPNVAAGGLLPPGQTAEQDLQGALDNIFNHPNVPPFVAKLLIQHLVTSNPSPAYVQRVAGVFRNNGSNVRGDMSAVVTAILMDPEARQGDDPVNVIATGGHLQEPILYMTGLLRAFGAASDGSNLASNGGSMGQTALFPGSVFNFFSPSYTIPETNLLGPEFQILTTATTFPRANWVNSFVFGSIGSGTTVDFTPYANLASDPNALLGSLNTLLMHGAMSAEMQSSILTAMQAVPTGSSQALTQARTAIYLIGTSSQYQVQH